MSPEIKLTISRNDSIIHSVAKTVEKQHLIRCLEEFQVEANAALTKMVEDLGVIDEASGDCNMDEDENDDEDNVDTFVPHKEEQNGHSKSKKIKCT